MSDAARAAGAGVGLTALAFAAMSAPVAVLTGWLPWDPSAIALGVSVRVATAVGFAAVLALSVWVGRRFARDGRGVDPRTFGGFVIGGGAVALAALGLAWHTSVGSPALVVTMAIAVLVSSSLPLLAGFLCGATIERLSSARDRPGEPLPARRPLWIPVWAGVAAATPLALDSAIRLSGFAREGVPAWTPRFGTAGETLAVYSVAVDALGGLLLVGLALACGRTAGRRYDLTDDLGPFLALVAAGSVFAVTLVWLAGAWIHGSAEPVPVAVATLLATYVSMAVVATLAAIAGVGVTEFEREGGLESRGDVDPDGSMRY